MYTQQRKLSNFFFRKGVYWSKKNHINWEAFSKISPFTKSFFYGNFALEQLASMLLKRGNKEKVLANLRNFFYYHKKIKIKKQSQKTLLVIRRKTRLSFVIQTFLRHRIAGRLKKKYIRRRTIEYAAYISFYKQWRRTIRFLGVFFKRRGRFFDKLKTEFAKLKSNNFHFRRDAILHRTVRLFTGLNLKLQKKNRTIYEEGFYLSSNPFIDKYFQASFSKYQRAFKNINFIKKAYPKARI